MVLPPSLVVLLLLLLLLAAATERRLDRHNTEPLPVCSAGAVCNKVDVYERVPRTDRICRCRRRRPPCSEAPTADDGHTVVDRTRLLKTCERLSSLPRCRYFRDVAWTMSNGTYRVHCRCPRNSIAYLVKRRRRPTGIYSFACSPQTRLRCRRKEPCRLFTVLKRADVEEVNTHDLCRCPHGHRCPSHHGDAAANDGLHHSGYCTA